MGYVRIDVFGRYVVGWMLASASAFDSLSVVLTIAAHHRHDLPPAARSLLGALPEQRGLNADLVIRRSRRRTWLLGS